MSVNSVKGFRLTDGSTAKYDYAYLENIITDTELTQEGVAADGKAVGDAIEGVENEIAELEQEITDVKSDLQDIQEEIEGGGSGMSEDFKQALHNILEKLAYIDEDGQDYLDALDSAMWPPVDLVSISAVYTQSGTVYDTDTLDRLKADLVVTAHMSDSTTQTVTAYTLSGTLAVGTSTVTVTYGGKTTTFTVTVTQQPTYITSGLIHRWDAIDNTRSGHSSSTAVWEDLVGTNDLTVNNITGMAWELDAVNFQGTSGTRFLGNELATTAENKTVEVVFSQDTARAECICSVFHNSDAVNPAYGKVVLFSDSTFNVRGESSKAYVTGLNSITDFHHIGASYSAVNAIYKAYANGVEAVQGSATHSLQTSSSYPSVGASPEHYDYAFNGKVHCIRIYNRILTDAEIAQNYSVDVTRFNLGA